MSLDLRLRAQRALHERYRLDQEIGRGGMAVVYRATDLESQEAVALKLLLPAVATHLGVNRFVREIALAGSLVHPNIMPIRGTGEADGLPYYVMPLLEGRSLRELMRVGTAPGVAAALRIGAQVADALAYAHARDIVHRDIKPENLLMQGDHVVVTDFGVGKALNVAGGSSLTATGFIVGTPAYLSPEQAAGDSDLDGRSDLYSLGIVLYEMIGGRLPFTGHTAQQVIASRFIETPDSLDAMRDDVPAGVAALGHGLLAIRPAERVANASEVARLLRHAAAGAA